MWRSLKNTLATLVPAVFLLVYTAVMICFLNRWDSMVAVTLVPIWTWAAIGMLASLLSWILFRGTFSIVIFCLSLATGLLFSEEPRTLLRELIPTSNDPSEKLIRIVNVNADNDENFLHPANDLDPDIVIIQQAPSEGALEAMANELFGPDHSIITNRSNAILARGEVINTLGEPDSATLHIRLRMPDGVLLDITNLDLDPYLPSLKLWRADIWRRLSKTRVENRRQLRQYLGENQLTMGSIGRIVSGGFGTPPGDDVFRPLESAQLVDSFKAAGTGWGNTFPADYPLVRLDQIWISENLTPTGSFAVANPGSTHRIVVTDVQPAASDEE